MVKVIREFQERTIADITLHETIARELGKRMLPEDLSEVPRDALSTLGVNAEFMFNGLVQGTLALALHNQLLSILKRS